MLNPFSEFLEDLDNFLIIDDKINEDSKIYDQDKLC